MRVPVSFPKISMGAPIITPDFQWARDNMVVLRSDLMQKAQEDRKTYGYVADMANDCWELAREIEQLASSDAFFDGADGGVEKALLYQFRRGTDVPTKVASEVMAEDRARYTAEKQNKYNEAAAKYRDLLSVFDRLSTALRELDQPNPPSASHSDQGPVQYPS